MFYDSRCDTRQRCLDALLSADLAVGFRVVLCQCVVEVTQDIERVRDILGLRGLGFDL